LEFALTGEKGREFLGRSADMLSDTGPIDSVQLAPHFAHGDRVGGKCGSVRTARWRLPVYNLPALSFANDV